jgi:hypothetical protein
MRRLGPSRLKARPIRHAAPRNPTRFQWKPLRPGPAPGLFMSGDRHRSTADAASLQDPLSHFCALQHKLWRQHCEECINLDSYLADYRTELMRTERPYPGQLWKHDSIRVIVVAVGPNTVTYEDLSGRAGVTRDSLRNFLAGFTRLKSPAR